MEEFKVHRFNLAGQVLFATVWFALNGIMWVAGGNAATPMAFVIPAFFTLGLAAYFYRMVFISPIRITVDRASGDVSVFSRRRLVRFQAGQVELLEIERGPNQNTRFWLYLSSGERIFFRANTFARFPVFVRMLVAANPRVETRRIPARWLDGPQ